MSTARIAFGLNQAESVGTNQCDACRLVFNSLHAFDRHRRDFRCLTPAEAGLSSVRRSRFNGGTIVADVYATPGREGGEPGGRERQNRFSAGTGGDRTDPAPETLQESA